jgi:hypothetical protein
MLRFVLRMCSSYCGSTGCSSAYVLLHSCPHACHSVAYCRRCLIVHIICLYFSVNLDATLITSVRGPPSRIRQCAVREMSAAFQALSALIAAEPPGKSVAYETCLSSMQATKDLAGDLEAVTVKQASAVSTELQDQWTQSSNKLYVLNRVLA